MRRKLVCVRQHNLTECGPACLASVAQYHGMKVPTIKLRQLAGTDKQGTNVLGMVEAAESLGFSAKGVRANYEALMMVPKPAVAHVVVQQVLQHYVVVYRSSSRGVTIADPAHGIATYSHDEFQKMWTGILVLLQPRESFGTGDKENSNCVRLWRLLRPECTLLVDGFIAALMYTLLSVVTALYVQQLTDDVLPNADRQLLNVLSTGMILVVALKGFFCWIRHLCVAYVSQRLDAKLIMGYYRHILELPQTFFDTRRVGEIISRVNDALKIRVAISNVALTLLVDALVVAFSVCIMILYSVQLSVVALGLLVMNGVLLVALHGPVRGTQHAVMEQSAELQSQLVSSVHGVATIRGFGAAQINILKVEGTVGKILRLVFKNNVYQMTMATCTEVCGSLALVVLLWYGGSLALASRLSTGELMSFYTLIGYLIVPAGRLSAAQLSVHEAMVASERLFEILAVETEEKLHHGSLVLSSDTLRGEIAFHDCSFGYRSRRQILVELNAHIPAGSMTAIVGECGSGKTTVLRLLQKCYELTGGKILLDGTDLATIATPSLRSVLGVVPQQVDLIHGSVKENIACGDITPDVKRVLHVARWVGADRFIEELPAGYDTFLGENGVVLSGGQSQLLAVARALYRQPKIVLLDEPTSAMDGEAESLLEQVLLTLRAQGRTIIIAAHHLGAIRHADKIMVLEKGRVAEEGSHQDLLQQQGRYFKLWKGQVMGQVLDVDAGQPPNPPC